MKLCDAAVWEVEMGRTPPPPASPAGGAYRLFDPVFAALPWLRKARLQVVDRTAGTGAPDWIVVRDVEDPEIFLLLGSGGRYAGACLVRPLDPDFTAPTGTAPGNWEVRGPVSSPGDLLRLTGLKIGSGRHIG